MKLMATRLTERLVAGLTAPERGQRIVFDKDARGLGVRITKNGAKSFIPDYRIHGRQRRLTIGSTPEWSLAAARNFAFELRNEIRRGIDPMDPNSRILRSRAHSVTDAWRRYERDYLPKLTRNTIADITRYWNRHILPAIGGKPLDTVTFGDVEALHRRIPGPFAANRAIESLRRVFNLAIRWEWCESNPAKGFETNPEHPRQQYLTADQVRRVLDELNAAGRSPNSAAIIKMLLLTGARFGEVPRMRWDDVDLEHGIWTKPATTTKQRRTHRVPISGPALEIIKGQPKGFELIFPRADGKPFLNVRKTWYRILDQACVPPVRIHDCRHSFASVLASNGVPLHVIGAMLGHSTPQTTARYAHLYDSVLHEAAERVGQLATPKPPNQL
jgi:integrase